MKNKLHFSLSFVHTKGVSGAGDFWSVFDEKTETLDPSGNYRWFRPNVLFYEKNKF